MAENIKQQLREAIGFYTADDLVRCAAQLVRVLGISGSLNLIQAINKLLQALQALRSILSLIQAIKGQIQGLGSFVFGLDFVKNLVMQQLTRVDACPLLSSLLWRELSRLGFGVNLQLFDWWKDKVSFLDKIGSDIQDELDEAIRILTMLQQLIQLAGDSLTISKPGFGGIDTGVGFGGQGKMFKDMLKIDFKKDDLPKIAPFEGGEISESDVLSALEGFRVREGIYYSYDYQRYLPVSMNLKDLGIGYSWVSTSMECEPFISFRDWIVWIENLFSGLSGDVYYHFSNIREESPGQLRIYYIGDRGDYRGLVILNHKFELEQNVGYLFNKYYMVGRTVVVQGEEHVVTEVNQLFWRMIIRQGDYHYVYGWVGFKTNKGPSGGFVGFFIFQYDLNFNFITSKIYSVTGAVNFTNFYYSKQLNVLYGVDGFSRYVVRLPVGQFQYNWVKQYSQGTEIHVMNLCSYQNQQKIVFGGKSFFDNRAFLALVASDFSYHSAIKFYFQRYSDRAHSLHKVSSYFDSVLVVAVGVEFYPGRLNVLCKFSIVNGQYQLQIAKEINILNEPYAYVVDNLISDDTGVYVSMYILWPFKRFLIKFDWNLNYLWSIRYLDGEELLCNSDVWRNQVFATGRIGDVVGCIRVDGINGVVDDCSRVERMTFPLNSLGDITSDAIVQSVSPPSINDCTVSQIDGFIMPKVQNKSVVRTAKC